MSMRIGIVLSSTPGYSETFFRSKIKGLQENGQCVRLFCSHKAEDFDLCPVTTAPKISRNPLFKAGYAIREFAKLLPHLPRVLRYIKFERGEGTSLLRVLKKIYLNAHLLKAQVDWLHFGFATIALGSETVARAIGAKMAVSFRGFDMTVYPVKNLDCYKILWKYVDKVHTISGSLLELARKNGLPQRIPYAKITPAIDMQVFHPTLSGFNQKQNLIFLTTGRLHWIKGFVSTLEALAILKAEGLNFSYKIIGEGVDYERIAFAAYQLGLKENVQFLGKLSYTHVKKELESATLYLQYSKQEGFCNAVLEAQAMGKLCIVSDAGGLSENVLHEQTGWVVPKYAPQLLAEQIRKVLLMDEQTKKEIAMTAMDRVKSDFNLEKQEREFINFYI